MTKKYLDTEGAAYLIKRIHEIMDEDLENYVTRKELQDELDALDIDIDLSNYVTKEELTDALVSYITASDLDNYATKTYVTNAINNASLGGGDGTAIDLSIYATKEDVNNALEDKADAEHTHDEYLTEHQDLSAYALKTEIPDTSRFLTSVPSTYVTETELATELANKADKTHTHNQYLTSDNLNDYATKEYVDNAIANNGTTGGDGTSGDTTTPEEKDDVTTITTTVVKKKDTSLYGSQYVDLELPKLKSFDGGTRMYVLPSYNYDEWYETLPLSVGMKDDAGRLIFDDYIYNKDKNGEIQKYVYIPNTKEGYLDDYIIYGFKGNMEELNQILPYTTDATINDAGNLIYQKKYDTSNAKGYIVFTFRPTFKSNWYYKIEKETESSWTASGSSFTLDVTDINSVTLKCEYGINTFDNPFSVEEIRAIDTVENVFSYEDVNLVTTLELESSNYRSAYIVDTDNVTSDVIENTYELVTSVDGVARPYYRVICKDYDVSDVYNSILFKSSDLNTYYFGDGHYLGQGINETYNVRDIDTVTVCVISNASGETVEIDRYVSYTLSTSITLWTTDKNGNNHTPYQTLIFNPPRETGAHTVYMIDGNYYWENNSVGEAVTYTGEYTKLDVSDIYGMLNIKVKYAGYFNYAIHNGNGLPFDIQSLPHVGIYDDIAEENIKINVSNMDELYFWVQDIKDSINSKSKVTFALEDINISDAYTTGTYTIYANGGNYSGTYDEKYYADTDWTLTKDDEHKYSHSGSYYKFDVSKLVGNVYVSFNWRVNGGNGSSRFAIWDDLGNLEVGKSKYYPEGSGYYTETHTKIVDVTDAEYIYVWQCYGAFTDMSVICPPVGTLSTDTVGLFEGNKYIRYSDEDLYMKTKETEDVSIGEYLSGLYSNEEIETIFVTKNEFETAVFNIETVQQDFVTTSDLLTKASIEHTHNIEDIIDYTVPDLSGYALKTEIPSLEGYAKTTDIPDVSNFITSTDVAATYQTEAQVQALINASLGVIENGTY